MLKYIYAIALFITIGGCSDKKDYRVQISSNDEYKSNADTIFRLSDQGVRITVSWKSSKPNKGTATLFDGENNPVLNLEYPTAMDNLTSDTAHVVNYDFKSNDKPGTWRMVMVFDQEELVNYPFTVQSGNDGSVEASLEASVDCYLADGKINTSNFYQLPENDKEWMNKQESGDFDLITNMRFELQKRLTQCMVSEFSYEKMEDWESYIEKLSGMKIRQTHPTVDERIQKVMPVYEEEFLFLNKDFVAWFAANLVPNPQVEQMNGLAFQFIYTKVFAERVRNLALTGLFYLSLPDGAIEDQVIYAENTARKYINQDEERVMERNDYFNAAEFITNRYQTKCSEWVSNTVGTEVHGEAPYSFSPIDMAFWLRRGIDGSQNELWLALRDVLKKYDKAWYDLFIDPHWAP